MNKTHARMIPLGLVVVTALIAMMACNSASDKPTATPDKPVAAAKDDGNSAAKAPDTASDKPADAAKGSSPADMKQGLLIGLAQFKTVEENGKKRRKPAAARLEIVTREGGKWKTTAIEDEGSNVFHKGFVYTPPGGKPGIVTLGAQDASVKLWRKDGGKWASTTMWTKDFGGKFNRMRDAEVADLYDDGMPSMAVATHDQGVVAVLHPQKDGTYKVNELDKKERTFVHEIEIGDVNGDKVLEVYSTPSEPNKLDGSIQTGQVMRYVPKTNAKPAVAADLGDRHAKEIMVADMDGDGVDELYVAVEAKTKKVDGKTKIVEPVEIRRYKADTDPKKGDVIATLQDRLCRFLTHGDVDGDGKQELVVAPFRSGLYMFRPTASGAWKEILIDKDSAGFEHASILLDLDGDKKDELYVASDKQGELRRYTWNGTGFDKEVIFKRDDPRSVITWNLMPVPVEMVK